MPSSYDTVRLAHAVIGPIAFVLLYPLGAMTIRMLNFKNVVWFHAGWMAFTYLLVLTTLGLGIWMAIVSDQLNNYHAIIGITVAGCLLVQPITGLTHHLLYKARKHGGVTTYTHVWWGRAIITLGIINGALGLMLSDNTMKGEIIYGVIAGVMWLTWMGVIFLAYIRSRKESDRETGNTAFNEEKRHGSTEGMQQDSVSGPSGYPSTRQSISSNVG